MAHEGDRRGRGTALAAGEHALHTEGDLRAARQWFEPAWRGAEGDGDHEGMARSALGLGGVWVHEHRTAEAESTVRTRQWQALAAAEPGSDLARRLRIRLAGEEDYRHGTHHAIMLELAEARTADEPVALVEALSLAHHCLLGPDHGQTRLALAKELIGHAGRTGRRGDMVMGVMWRTVDLFLLGDPHAERGLRELEALLDRSPHLAAGFIASAIRVMLAIRQGRFAHAENLATASAERGTAAGDRDAAGWYGGQLGTIRWFQGRIAELTDLMHDQADSPVLSAVDNSYFAGLAVAAATAGEHRLAAGMLARIRGRDLAALPRSSSWLYTMYGVAETAHLLGDETASAEVYDLLSPHEGSPVIASLGVTCLGSAHHPLGVASLTLGRPDRAIGHFRCAVRDNLALGHWPATVLSRWRLGHALALRHGPDDDGALRELELATKEAAELGMDLPAPVVRRSPGPWSATARRHGRHWRLDLGGRSVVVEHSVGMGHLAVLIANPGREVSAADLAGVPGQPPDQPVLDTTARRAYEARLARLQEAIEEREALTDTAGATALRAEHAWLAGELAAATGLGGRSRAFAGDGERARVAVGKAIRRALARIEELDEAVAAELRATVKTGARCGYHPR
ncbi:hypothetical protein [Herbidospora yilanensis]|uniref:hypothetical protein n=1 Tax=Herbidospora yilanensis TaxID=354426 RepID=UPI0007828DF2|nr:hypothetical protein [Herbidospora yilanensis]